MYLRSRYILVNTKIFPRFVSILIFIDVHKRINADVVKFNVEVVTFLDLKQLKQIRLLVPMI